MFRARQQSKPPADAIHPEKWLAGRRLYQMHTWSPLTGMCVNCGSTRYPHCEFALLGYTVMRLALADPSTLPVDPA